MEHEGATIYLPRKRLRPVFGPGEDWNNEAAFVLLMKDAVLRPVFGPGEDWNRTMRPEE